MSCNPNYDTFYNKKRNYPNAEERLYDDLPSREVLLTKPDQKTKGIYCKAKFLNDNSRCMLNVTKSHLQNHHVRMFVGYIITDECTSYEVTNLRLNEFPKYIIADLKPASFHRKAMFDTARWRGKIHKMDCDL